MSQLVIVGTGLAGYTVAREFRKLDTTNAITLITADEGAFYSKPMLSNAFAQNKTPTTLVNIAVNQMARQLDATILSETTVTEIDRERRLVKCGDKHIPFDSLVLATGAHAIPLPVGGSGAQDVFSVNSLSDYAVFRDALTDVKNVVLIGGGLIGCEFANDLCRGGFRVTLVHLGATLLDNLVPAAVGEGLQRKLEQVGVDIITGTTVGSVDKTAANEYVLTLNDGRELSAQRVMSAIGLVPAIELARTAGIDCVRGVVTNQFLETSDPEIYAVGDCAQLNNLWLPYVMPIMHQARSLAKTLSTEKTAVTYPVMPVVVKTPAFPVTVVPPTTQTGEWQISSDENGVRAIFQDENSHLRGFALGGDFNSEKSTLIKQLVG